MTTAKPESRLQRRIQAALHEAFPGCWTFKVHVDHFTAEGTPDLLACIEGLFFGFEVKVDDDDAPTELQAYNIRQINRAGGVAASITSPEQAVALVRKALAVKKRPTMQEIADEIQASEREFRPHRRLT